MFVQGPYYNRSQAAAYLGYKPSTFDALRKQFNIPTCGPKGNRFAQSVLDAFMEAPHSFKRQPTPTRRRRPVPVTA